MKIALSAVLALAACTKGHVVPKEQHEEPAKHVVDPPRTAAAGDCGPLVADAFPGATIEMRPSALGTVCVVTDAAKGLTALVAVACPPFAKAWSEQVSATIVAQAADDATRCVATVATSGAWAARADEVAHAVLARARALPPKTVTADDVKPKHVVSITKDGSMYLGGAAIEQADLEAALRKLVAQDAAVEVVVQADADVPYEIVVQVMDSAKRAGVTHIAIASRAVDVTVPRAPASATASHQLMVEVHADGKIVVHGNPVPLEDLGAVFKQAVEQDKDVQIVIQADEKVSHGQVVQVMEKAKAAGATKMAISTRK